jgi:hypothetical protein
VTFETFNTFFEGYDFEGDLAVPWISLHTGDDENDSTFPAPIDRARSI